MIYGDTELRKMVHVLGTAISRVVSGERAMELFGVDEDGAASDAVIIIIGGDDWPEVERLLKPLYNIDAGGYESHNFGTPEDN